MKKQKREIFSNNVDLYDNCDCVLLIILIILFFNFTSSIRHRELYLSVPCKIFFFFVKKKEYHEDNERNNKTILMCFTQRQN